MSCSIAHCTNMISRAAPVPHLEQDDSTASSLVDVDSPHVNIVKSDFEEQKVQTETQAERIEQESEAKARAAAAKAEEKVNNLQKKAAAEAKNAKKELKKDAKKFDENKDNPVFVGNYILWGVTAAAVGYGAYKKNAEGKLDMQLAGTVALGLGALGAADYFVSK